MRFATLILLSGLVALGPSPLRAQDYPVKPIRIVTGSAGGGGDFVVRLIAPGLSSALHQQVVVDNRGGLAPGEGVAKAAPDGYTLLLEGFSFLVGPLLQNTPYDPVKDFSPITLAVLYPNIVVVHPSLPAKTVRELIALAKARPGELNYGSGGIGSSNHLAMELFNTMAQINIVRVNYKGAGPATTALLAGEVQVIILNAAAATPHIKSGKLRALAVTTGKPSPLVPGLPTVTASGLPGYESISLSGVYAPARTPAAVVTRLNQEVVRVVNAPDIKDKLFNAGVEAVGSTASDLGETVKSEIAKWSKVIKDAGIRAD